MKSKKQKKGGSNTNPLFTDFSIGINLITRLLEIIFFIGLCLVLTYLIRIGPRRLLEMYRELGTEIMINFIEPLIQGEQIEIIVEDGYETPSDSSDDEQGVIQNIVETTLRKRTPTK